VGSERGAEEHQLHDVLKMCPYFPCERDLTRKNQATMFLAPPYQIATCFFLWGEYLPDSLQKVKQKVKKFNL
jgi:hypothetical protein